LGRLPEGGTNPTGKGIKKAMNAQLEGEKFREGFFKPLTKRRGGKDSINDNSMGFVVL